MGLANTGGVASMSAGYATEGTYTSAVLDATQISRFGKLQLHGSLPAGTSLRVQTRSGNVKVADEKGWSKWSQPVAATEFLDVTAPAARFLQYRLTFKSTKPDATALVEDVNVAYQVPNLPPVLKSIKITPNPDAPAVAVTPGGGPVADETPRIASARKQTIAWEASDPNADALQYSLYFRRGSTGPWIPLKEKLTDAQFEWDTRSVADGRYAVKVVASDARANATGQGRTTSRVSDPVLVDNTPPAVGNVKWQQKGEAIEVTLRAVDRTSVVAALDYAVDANRDWQAVLPSDNIFDSPEETASFAVRGLGAGPHQIALRATDAKGNQAFETVLVTVEGPAAKNE
jgi:hypothetical protein